MYSCITLEHTVCNNNSAVTVEKDTHLKLNLHHYLYLNIFN